MWSRSRSVFFNACCRWSPSRGQNLLRVLQYSLHPRLRYQGLPANLLGHSSDVHGVMASSAQALSQTQLAVPKRGRAELRQGDLARDPTERVLAQRGQREPGEKPEVSQSECRRRDRGVVAGWLDSPFAPVRLDHVLCPPPLQSPILRGLERHQHLSRLARRLHPRHNVHDRPKVVGSCERESEVRIEKDSEEEETYSPCLGAAWSRKGRRSQRPSSRAAPGAQFFPPRPRPPRNPSERVPPQARGRPASTPGPLDWVWGRRG